MKLFLIKILTHNYYVKGANIRVAHEQQLIQLKSRAYLVLDGLDDLVVGGEDNGDGDNEAECEDVGHVGDVVRSVPFHSTTKSSNNMKKFF